MKEFRETIRRIEVPLNYYFLLLLRMSPASTIRRLLGPFGLDGLLASEHFGLEALEDTNFTQPDVRLESKRARIYIEIKRKGGKIALEQVQKYLLLHADMDTRYGRKDPYLLFLTPGPFASYWRPHGACQGDIQAFLNHETEVPLGALEAGVASDVLARYSEVRGAVRYGAATWNEVGTCLGKAYSELKCSGRSDAELCMISDFLGELERRGVCASISAIRCAAPDDWVFPVGEGIVADTANGRWSDGAFFEDGDTPVRWHQAEPAPHVEDREVWARWLAYLRESPAAAAESLLVVAKSRAYKKLHEAEEAHSDGRLSGLTPRTEN